mmetsp:Transcript_34611/g.81600  ORF Transcript_34611/g.81600 Transcript_34611/m.81600 type:complete len:462 (+) Transcript_34611:174-1559(+)
MMIVRWISLLPMAVVTGRHSVVGNPISSTRRTYMTVEYDYKLEANITDVDFGEQYNINALKPAEDALHQIDSSIIDSIQLALPNGGIPEGKTIPDIEFNTVTSRFINMCFTESDACKWVKSRIRLSYVGERPKNAMERVTLGLVKDHLQEINDSNPLVTTTYVYPMIYSSVVQFHISPADGPMSDTDIKLLEEAFTKVFHATVSALDGDTDVSEGYFVYQDTEDLEVQEVEDGIALAPPSMVSVDMTYFGKCRYCEEDELVETVDASIQDNLASFIRYLKTHGGPYFQRVEEIAFSKPDLPDGLPPTENASVYDMTPPKASKNLPWALWLGVGVTIVVLATGILIIVRDQKKLSKEEASTGEESSVYEERNHENDEDDEDDENDENDEDDEDIEDDNHSDSDSSENDDDENDDENNGDSGNIDENGTDLECGTSVEESSTVSNKETFDSTGAHSNYEVYVY